MERADTALGLALDDPSVARPMRPGAEGPCCRGRPFMEARSTEENETEGTTVVAFDCGATCLTAWATHEGAASPAWRIRLGMDRRGRPAPSSWDGATASLDGDLVASSATSSFGDRP